MRPSPDAAGFIFLQKQTLDRQLLGFRIRYNMVGTSTSPTEIWDGIEVANSYGAASLPLLINRSQHSGKVQHRISGWDGIEAESLWIL
ncbi:MAG: hypothetical protein ACRD4B_01450 [Acidobacteriota bacterium]